MSILFLQGWTIPERKDNWPDEVSPIISKAERQVYLSLRNEEDRLRFQEMFWQMRDPNPETKKNEYREEFYARIAYAKSHLYGVNSDRGRIYILIGPPAERKDFTGQDGLSDCELWVYTGLGKFGLPPMLYLLFYKAFDAGDYRLFYPGANSALDILSQEGQTGLYTRDQAYAMVRKRNAELAAATVSVIPDQGMSPYPASSLSSGTILAHIMSLPESQNKTSYLKSFSLPQGNIDVTWTTQEIVGDGALAISQVNGVKFLSYSLMPETIRGTMDADGSSSALIMTILRIEDSAGALIYQQEREVKLKLNAAIQKEIEARKCVFNDFAPIVNGTFKVHLTFINKTTKESFVFEDRINVSEEIPPLLIGTLMKEIESSRYLPFSIDSQKIPMDPRFIFPKESPLEGLLATDADVHIAMLPLEKKAPPLEVTDIVRHGKSLHFRQALNDVPEGHYFLCFRIGDAEVFRQRIAILPFAVNRPLEFERTEDQAFRWQAQRILAREYVNLKEPEAALKSLDVLPNDQRNLETMIMAAQAQYLQKHFAQVLDLLEPETVLKSPVVLLLLGNSSLELKNLEKAASYFEELRKFGDTAENNSLLGAIYFSLGKKDKAQVYWERAKNLESKKSGEKEDKRDSTSSY